MNEQQELHDSVAAWVSRINESWQGTVRNIVETGKALIDAKADHGHCRKWEDAVYLCEVFMSLASQAARLAGLL